MILEHLEQMREKPHAVRRRFAFLCASFVTAAVALTWGMSLPSQLASLSLSGVVLPEEADISSVGESISEKNADLGKTLATPEEIEDALSAFNEGDMYQENTLLAPSLIASPQVNGEGATRTDSGKVFLETTKSPGVLIATSSTERRE